MKATEYQVKQEKLTIELNKISDLVENNNFTIDTKDKVSLAVEKGTICILDNRNEVHQFMHGDKVDAIAFHKKDTLASHQKNTNIDNAKYIAHEAIEIAVKLKNEPAAGVIMDESTLKKYNPTERFKTNEVLITEAIDEIINALKVVGSEESTGDEKPKKKKKLIDKLMGE